MSKSSAAANIATAVAPSFGPAIVSLFGIQIPVVALGISMLALLLSRQIAKPPARKLTRKQQFSMNALLAIILFLIVTGQLFVEGPLGVGSAVVWAIGLGLSGMLILEILEDTVLSWFRRFIAAWKASGGETK